MSQLSLSGRIVEQIELNENFSSQRKRFLAAGADSQLIDAAFQRFKQLKDKGLLSLEQKDIDRYPSLEKLQAVIAEKSGTKTKTQQRKEQKVAGAELVYEDTRYRVYHIMTQEASKLYGKGTNWCISTDKDNRFYYVTLQGTVYMAMPVLENDEKVAVWVNRVDNKKVAWSAEGKELPRMPQPLAAAEAQGVFKYVEQA